MLRSVSDIWHMPRLLKTSEVQASRDDGQAEVIVYLSVLADGVIHCLFSPFVLSPSKHENFFQTVFF